MAIHPTAIVSKKAKLGKNVEIGPFSIIYDNVVLADEVKIGSHCEIGVANHLSEGAPLFLSSKSLIRSHSVFYEGSEFGEGLITGHRVTVREKTKAGKNLQIGTLSDIQGHCEIGDYVRLHSNVHIGQKSRIGNFVWIYPYVVLTNDPHPPSEILKGVSIEDFAVIATMSVILPGVKIARNSFVGAHSLLNQDTEEGLLYSGSPARKVCPAGKIRLQDGSRRIAYPWTRHFHRGYPAEIVREWKKHE